MPLKVSGYKAFSLQPNFQLSAKEFAMSSYLTSEMSGAHGRAIEIQIKVRMSVSIRFLNRSPL